VGFIVQPRILIKPRFSLIGIDNIIYNNEDNVFFVANKVGNDFFYNHSHLIKNPRNINNYMAVVQYIEGGADYTHYIPSLEVAKIQDIPSGMISLTIPAQKYAVFKYIGFHHPKLTTIESLQKIHKFIFNKWLPQSGYYSSKSFHLESIDYKIARDDYCEMDLFIPIE